MASTACTPRRALLHPVWLGSLALLLLNDELLKGAALLPSTITGKLSDFVGLLVAPALLATLLRVEHKRTWALVHIATGAAFAGINIWPAMARAVETLSALTPVSWFITVDASDLIALPMLLLSYRLFGRQPRRPASIERQSTNWLRTATRGAMLTIGMLACMGTSRDPCGSEECPTAAEYTDEQASLTIGNTTELPQIVRLRALKESIVADCEVMLDEPTEALHRGMFAPAEAWLLEPGRALPLLERQDGTCSAYLVDAQGLPLTLLAWSRTQFRPRRLPTTVSYADFAPGQMLMLRQVGGELALDDHVAVFDAPAETSAIPEPRCEVPSELIGLAWSDPLLGTHTLLQLFSSPDGCHELTFEKGRFQLCLPLEDLGFEIGEQLTISAFTPSYDAGRGTSGNDRGIALHGQNQIVRAATGSATLFPSFDDAYDVSYETLPGCAPHHDTCDNLVTPLAATYLGGGFLTLEAGQSAQHAQDGSTLYLVRAQRMPIRDMACTDTQLGNATDYFESVLVTPLSPEAN